MLSECNGLTDRYHRELIQHGTTDFPFACYHDDLVKDEVPWHWHEELEAAIVTEGSIHLVIGNEQTELNTGDGFFVNTGVLHSCRRRSTEIQGTGTQNSGSCRLHSMVFHSRLAGGSPESVFHQKYVLPVIGSKGFGGMCLRREIPWQKEVLDGMEGAWQACAGEPPYYELKVRTAVSIVLAKIAEHLTAVPGDVSPKTLRDGERIKQMLQFIMDHYGEEIGTAGIARSASVSESECLRCFRGMIGTTPIRYLREYRIGQAAEQLSAGRTSIADVAARCGFQDISYFTKTFRELKGETPKKYREKRQSAGKASKK